MPPVAVQRGTRKAGNIIFSAKKASAGTILKAKAVYISDVDSNGIYLVEPVDATMSKRARGVTAEDIDNSEDGVVVLAGFIYGLDTSSWAAQDDLYLSESTPGDLTTTIPDGLQYDIEPVASVIKSHASNGILEVYNAGKIPYTPLEKNEVYLTNGPFDTSSTEWVDIPNTNVGPFTPIAGEVVNVNVVATGLVVTGSWVRFYVDVAHNNSGAFQRLGQTFGLTYIETGTTGQEHPMCFSYMGIALPNAQATTFKLQFKVSSGTCRMQASTNRTPLVLQVVRKP